MPKAANSSTTPALRRNQACRSCRKRKLKCDAAKPACGTCVKHFKATIAVPPPPGYVHPTEPQCFYDPIEGLSLAPDVDPLEKIRSLEEEVANLRSKLALQGIQSRSESPHGVHRSHSRNSSHPITSPYPSFAGRTSPPERTGSGSGKQRMGNIVLPQASLDMMLGPDSHQEMARLESIYGGSPETHGSPDSQGLIYPGWNKDLPDPAWLMHLVEIFFKCDPCGSRILHRPSFMATLHLPPTDPGFPHSAILHAICATASRWAPRQVTLAPDGTRRDRFAEYHAGKTRQYIDRTMASGADIFQVLQATILLSWYFYCEGRWVEVWIFSGFQTRVAVPLRLNYPGTFTTHGNNSPGAYLAPPQSMKELEMRRRAWWMTLVFDRIVSVGGWLHGIDERDIGTELPLRAVDFESETQVPSNPQDLATEEIFIRHMPMYTDPFILLIKASMLFGRVTDYNVRHNLRAPSLSAREDPNMAPGFAELDRLVSEEFVANLPAMYKSPLGQGDAPDGTNLDTDLYMVHIIPHAAAITLHNPYIDFSSPNSLSTVRCLNSARAILSYYYLLTSTSFDMTRLHPFVTICWYLAAVVNVQLCKHFIEVGDTENETNTWAEINVMRFAMLEYGGHSPIGSRQEKLLQGLMTEIVRMTTQRQPLEVGFPLYHFSHATAFAGRGDQDEDEDMGGPVAPLPVRTHSS